MTGAGSASRIGGSLRCAAALEETGGAAGATGADVIGADTTGRGVEAGAVADPSARATPTVAVAGNNVVPHIPQKRFVAGFSLPQRGQRKFPPPYSLRYLLDAAPNVSGAAEIVTTGATNFDRKSR